MFVVGVSMVGGRSWRHGSEGSEPGVKCTLCTSYNRCVVTVFTYKCDMAVDEIKWQEEEVSWVLL